ncbi:hypothetical protein MNAB215_4282 [Mycobacterium numidiamassiliense]|uniref:DUF6745 domain-containing protein n=2 Tax=Mycobacterium numidiamassiliense TaxID=1841861 RepID=A0A2U3PE72_9MYCO|nr:hypothetical protein MNAB215_4282 [Mycobacterium numidiamassiliense]
MSAGLSTRRCDKPRAEASVRTAYRTAGLDEPQLIVWMDSPLGGMFAAGIIKSAATFQLDGPVWSLLGRQPWDQVVDELGSELAQQLWGQLTAQLGDQLGTQLKDQLSDPLEHQLNDPLGRQLALNLRDGLWSQLKDQVDGHKLNDQLMYQLQDPPADTLWEEISLWRDCAWLASMACALRLAGLENSPLDAVCMASREVDWWWPMSEAVVLTDRPTVISRDPQGHLHNDKGPALVYADGYTVHARHGTLLPPA